MITLHRLTIRDFKSLRAVDLTFPPNASVLIEGFNESGKSSLFEAVVFALYGEPLVTEETGARGRGRAESAIRYGAEVATVRLVCDIDATRLVVERSLRKRGQTQATLEVWHGQQYEAVRGQTEVSRRILEELGNLTKDAILNSCFVEQKQLGKLEDMTSADRQQSLEQLLNLARLGKIQRQFEVSREEQGAADLADMRLRFADQGRQLAENAALLAAAEREAQTLTLAQLLAQQATAHAELARWRAEAHDLTAERARYADADAQLHRLAAARAPLADLFDAQRRRDQLAQESAYIALGLARCDVAEREELPRLQTRARRLDSVVARFAEIADLQRLIADYEAEMRELDLQLAEIAQRQGSSDDLASEIAYETAAIDAFAATLAAEEATQNAALSAADMRGAALLALSARLERRERAQQRRDLAGRDVAEWQRRHREADLAQAEADQHRARVADLVAQEAAQNAELATTQALWRNAVARDALTQWLHGADEADHLTQLRAAQDEARQQLQTAQAGAYQRATLVSAARRTLLLSGVGAALNLAVAVGALLVGYVWGVLLVGYVWGAALLLVTGALGGLAYRAARRGVRLRTRAREAAVAAQAAERAVTKAQADEEAWRTVGGGKLRDEALRLLRTAKFADPTDAADARQRLDALPPADGPPTEWEAQLRAAEGALALIQQQRALAEAQRSAAERRRADMGDVDTEGVRVQSALSEADGARNAAEAEVMQAAARLGLAASQEAITNALTQHQAEREQVMLALAALPGRHQALDERRARLAQRRQEHAAHLTWLTAAQTPDHEARQDALAAQRASALGDAEALRQGIAIDCQALSLVPELPIVLTEKGAVEGEARAQAEIVAGRAVLLARAAALQQDVAAVNEGTVVAWGQLRAAMPELALHAVPPTDGAALTAIDARLAALAEALNTADSAQQLTEINQRLGSLTDRINTAEKDSAALAGQITVLADDLGYDATDATLAARLPTPAPEQLVAQRERSEALSRARYLLQNEHAQLAQQLSIAPDTLLDYAECAHIASQLRQELAIKAQAIGIAKEVRRRMIQKVLPQTTQNMRQLLPLLTLDRYHDCEITDDYKLLIYDETADRTVAKNVFSGGARDQFSLALRLAFALATLPEALGTTPSFIFLDEPLSSFDAPRSEALVQLLTRGQIHDHFSQIFVISHNLLFDRGAFTHHLRIEAGAVVESTLPSGESVAYGR